MGDVRTTKVPDGRAGCEIEVRNSKFVGLAVPAASPEEAREKIRKTREEHEGCTHVVYAFITGGDSSEVSGMSDDGEPRGTAGRPVMDILKGSGIVDVLLMVVRYFGGTKLGTGGLVKAYGDCARETLSRLPVRPLVDMIDFSLEVTYDIHESVRDAIKAAGGEIRVEDFGERVRLEGTVPRSEAAALSGRLEDISRGSISL